MGDIFRPASLTGATAAKGILEQLEKLSDPENRKRIEADIIAAHKLNDAEAKKAADARELIKKHQDILDETQRVAGTIVLEKKALAQEKLDFAAEMLAARTKLNSDISAAGEALEKAQQLQASAKAAQDDVRTREDALQQKLDMHGSNTAEFEKSKKALLKEREDLEVFKKEVLALDTATKEKVEKLKQFNF